jgi:branched-chain amino acid transport system permease protein
MLKLLKYLNGPQTIGKSKIFWVLFIVGIIGFLVYPLFVSDFQVINTTYYILNIPMALGLCLLWGFGGILSFGQVAFFGIGGYIYGIIAGNLMGNAFGGLVGVFGALFISAIISILFGYFLFYGRVDKWVIPILTLVLNLVLNTFMNQTAGYYWKIGDVLLGGYNGMVGIPSLNIGNYTFFGLSFYYLVLAMVILLFLVLRIIMNSPFGNVINGMREDTIRTEFLGHNIRLIQLLIFSIAAVLASLSGIFYVQWGNFISPEAMGILKGTLPVVWVVVGGYNLIGVMIATVVLTYLDYTFAAQGSEYAFVFMGVILVAVIMFRNIGFSGLKK